MIIMKQRILFLVLAAVLPFLSSCSDYLDKRPDDQLDIDSAFENSTNLDRWLAYIYDGIPQFYADSNWDMIGKDATIPANWISVGNQVCNYQTGNWTPSNGQIINFWTDFSKRIRSAYIFIEKAHPLTDVSQNDIDIMKAECRFFIAYFHSLLVMTYGAVPIISEAAPTTNAEDLMVEQRPFYEVVDWCANEFYEVSRLLPVSYSDQANDYGRATSLWALAMRARLLTFAASLLVNGNPDMASVVNCNGEQIFSTSYDPQRWRDAMDANKELIDAAEANDYELYEAPSVDGEADPYMSYFGALMLRRNQGNYEIIMPRTEDGAGWMDKKSAPRSIADQAGVIGVTQDLVDAFFMANGKVAISGHNPDGSPVIPNNGSGYTEAAFGQAPTASDFSSAPMTAKTNYFYNDPNGYSGDGKKEHVITEADTYNMYCNREPRFYVSVMYNESFNWAKTHQDKTESNPTDKKDVNFFVGQEDGKDGSDYPTAGYLMKKRIAPDYLGDASSGEFNKRHGVIYRLAEAYLAYAECMYEYSVSDGVNQYETNKATITEYINKIRRRAGIPEYGSTELGDLDAAAAAAGMTVRDLIRRERRIELNCEGGLSWQDLRRWKLAETELDGPFYGMNMDAGTRETFYVRTKYQDRVFKSYWWPVPQDDIDRNPNLRQLPGW